MLLASQIYAPATLLFKREKEKIKTLDSFMRSENGRMERE
jgi:hypothetical protein